MQIPGYRRLEPGEMIQSGDWRNSKRHDSALGLCRTTIPGATVLAADPSWYYRPLPRIDSERTDMADIDKLCSFLLMNFPNEATITEKSADIAIRLLTKFKAVMEAMK